jgi:ribosomal protein S6--L-glutamate ligase/tetrahydromethanopterin:alpha-L-glutamate ligase
MKFGLLTRSIDAWCSRHLYEAMKERGVEPVSIRFRDLIARVSSNPAVELNDGTDLLKEVAAILVRPIGRGSLDEIIYRLDVLQRLSSLGMRVINNPGSIEKAVDKYRTLALLEENGVPVPRTIVAEDPRLALKAFDELGGDVVIKPIFGSRGIGITRVTDREVASRILRTLAFHHHVLYLQEFIPHGNRDIRAFVIGQEVAAAMHRVGNGWKTNVSQGAAAVPLKPTTEVESLATKAAKVIGCEIAGVDILEGDDKLLINEINSQPGFRGLQSTTKVNLPEKIVDYMLSQTRR